ncbi:NlpC/P60 family protein [Vibrio genomosp. F10 str. 9ZC157]|nr:NlpC/P60 family protein [Vibrio genomosp. F10]OEE34560.1 hypothetical protein A1QO_06915 [Vibrio genomosp. F10 str. ZF-129]OEE93419.1 hypothetical protein A1QM_09615 [Vibrio genomosp. F10 str. 9ZC157]
MTKLKITTIIIIGIGFLIGCTNTSGPSKPVSGSSSSASGSPTLSAYEHKVKQSFMNVYERWKGVPYRLGGTSFQGIDCSAFVQIAYHDALNVKLPRTTLHQSKVGSKVGYDEAEVGDLIFFRTSRTTRHVGVYLGNRQFLHASTSKGVIISRVDNPYWASKFWHYRRVEYPPIVN